MVNGDEGEKKHKFTREDFDLAYHTRNFEIDWFWKRSNYFLVLNLALMVGAFKQDATLGRLLFSFFGLLASVLWLRVNIGSKFWQERWEMKLSKIEEKISPGLDFFGQEREDIITEVREKFNHVGKKGLSYDWVLKKPSVSNNMIGLSGLFIIFWAIVVSYNIAMSINSLKLYL